MTSKKDEFGQNCTLPASMAVADPATPQASSRHRRTASNKSWSGRSLVFAAVAVIAVFLPATTMAQQCIPLSGSVACPAFNQSSISLHPNVTKLFPFLDYVSDRETFDSSLQSFIATSYAQTKYQTLFGCSSVNVTNTTSLYARYTTSVLCNAVIQNSVPYCNLTGSAATPLCAVTCADFATSEEEITATPELCGSPGPNAMPQIRADFTTCSLPDNALTGQCVTGAANEPDDCGYGSNLGGLCTFCAGSSVNATDSCCVNSNAEGRCKNVHLPTIVSMASLDFTATSTATSTATTGAAAAGASKGLTGGEIAGIVVGSVVGALAILALVIFLCVLYRRRRNSQAGSIFNQPSPARSGPAPPMAYADGARGADVLPGARVARMSALEGSSTSSRRDGSSRGGLAPHYTGSDTSRSPGSNRSGLAGGALPKRNGSLSSSSALGAHSTPSEDPHSPQTSYNNDHFSSPEGVASGQSEQLQFFKDYYSQDEIRPGDTVSTLWAYQPRANDEFELERGDMLKIVGIWDDGWATGVRLSERAEDWEASRQTQRDSGMSSGSRKSSGPVDGEIKAFPLVCVCLPRHWRKTIEGDTAATETGPSDQQPRRSSEGGGPGHS